MEYEFRLAKFDDLDNICNIFLNAAQHMNNQDIFQWDEIYPNHEVFENDTKNNQIYI
jgi:hypothetical protein